MNETCLARPIKRLLVVNRGEIAARILQACRELPSPVHTLALYTHGDYGHCKLGHPDQEILIPSAGAYMDISYLVLLAVEHDVDTIHPGYGFLSENAEFVRRMWDEARVTVIGPGWAALMNTGNKLQAKALAKECNVPVLQATDTASSDLAKIEACVALVGLPVMIKAVDGGGGRGIRLVRTAEELAVAVNRAIGESPSRSVFVEKAAVDGFRHIEVQIVGDNYGQVRHLWERDCSIQRRFQKVVEYAPSISVNHKLIETVITAAVNMAKKIAYRSLGTFEFLVNDAKSEYYFLEINPRLQVEHTITENITGVDLVRAQLLLAQGSTLAEAGLHNAHLPPPKRFSIQFRLYAENPKANFSLSTGTITGFTLPGGNGVRVDSNLCCPLSVGTDFDSLLAKVTVTGHSWEATVCKGQRALDDTNIIGVKTNLDVLRGIAHDRAFMGGDVDTQWLQEHLQPIIRRGESISSSLTAQYSSLSSSAPTPRHEMPVSASISPSSGGFSIHDGASWSFVSEPTDRNNTDQLTLHQIRFSRIIRDELPSSLSAEVDYTAPLLPSPLSYHLQLRAMDPLPAKPTAPTQRMGDASNPNHIVFQIPGRLIEVMVEIGDSVERNQVIAFIKQMKMEIEIRSPRAGKVNWVYELEENDEVEGVNVDKGMLLLEFEQGDQLQRRKTPSQKGKL